MHKNIIILFDIDGILLFDDNLGMTCFTSVLKKFTSFDEISLDYVPHGKTDLQILKELLKDSDIPLNINIEKAAFNYYVNKAKESIRDFEIAALPGTLELLQNLYSENYEIGIMSGNAKEIGLLKLKKSRF